MTQRAIETFARNLWGHWKSRDEFVKAQKHVAGILALAFVGNNWPASYPRDENENAAMFWVMNVAILVAALVTLQHDANGSSRGIQPLSRYQTEEWKGWMQWAFIMVSTTTITRYNQSFLFVDRILMRLEYASSITTSGLASSTTKFEFSYPPTSS